MTEESKSSDPFLSFSQRSNADNESLTPNWVDSLNKVVINNTTHVFARDILRDRGAKIYTSDLTHQEMIIYQSTQARADRNFYEIFLDDKPLKLFYDIDMSPQNNNDDFLNHLCNGIIEITTTSLRELYGIDDVSINDFAILDSSGEFVTNAGVITTKTSLHIILVNKIRFKNISQMKEYVNFVFSASSGYITDNINYHIDTGVYRRRGSLRIPGSTKRGQNRHLLIITPAFSQLDCLITYTSNDTDDIQMIEKPPKRNNKRKEDQILRSMQVQITGQQLGNDDIFQKIVDALPLELSEDYSKWVAVGIKLYTAGANEIYWHEFSKKCSTYNYDVAHSKWLSFRHYGTGNMAGLFRLLKECDCNDLVTELGVHTIRFMGKYNNEIAMGLARLYGDDHIFSRGKWYYFDKSKWILDEEKTCIARTIMTSFQNKLNKELKSINQYLDNISPDHPRYNEENARIKNLMAIKEKTQSGRINNDWHTLSVAFDQPLFACSLDSYNDLIGFENGTFNLKTGEFEESSRDHRITMSTRYDYIQPFDVLDDDKLELDDLLHQIFPDDQILQYMLCFLGSCLSGNVYEELIHFWTGLSNKQTGSNGKSTFVSLLLLTFGDYSECGHSSIITSRRENSSNTNSALMSLKGKRLVTFQEIDNENSINMPVIKALTGNDQITGRQLYKQQETFTPQWKLVVCANKLPPVSSDDGGTQRRLRNIPFESKFVADVNEAKWQGMSNIFQVDYNLKQKLSRYRMPLMHRLIEGFNQYKRSGGLPLCRKIMNHTSQYFQQHNAIYQFLSNRITPSVGSIISLREVLFHVNSSSRQQSYYAEEDIIETCKDSFPSIKIVPLSQTDSRLVILDYKRADEY